MKLVAIDMNKYKLLMVFLALAKTAFLQAQQLPDLPTKTERETRISYSEFPEAAKGFISQINPTKKRTRYYRETDGKRTSYEAKFKLKGNKYSVECTPNGQIEDIEISINKKQIKKTLWAQINNQLSQESKRFKIEKIQEQYIFNPIVINQISHRTPDYYELIVAFKNKRKIYYKELLFNLDGNIVKSTLIKRQAYDFIIF